MWFGKKRFDGNSSANAGANNLHTINNSLKESFSRIRVDMEAVRGWIDYFKDREKDQEERLKNIESKLEEVSEVVALMGEKKTEVNRDFIMINEDDQETEEETPRILDDLTETQKSIFLRLGTLLYESSQEWITTKALAQELYPDKQYDKVRSTLSEYISILIEAGLVKKKRHGKLTYLSITEKGLSLFEKSKKAKLKKILIKKKSRE